MALKISGTKQKQYGRTSFEHSYGKISTIVNRFFPFEASPKPGWLAFSHNNKMTQKTEIVP
ncbi:MAG: hypothetical protein ACTTKO_07620 [Candidatus Limimorpha sp.]